MSSRLFRRRRRRDCCKYIRTESSTKYGDTTHLSVNLGQVQFREKHRAHKRDGPLGIVQNTANSLHLMEHNLTADKTQGRWLNVSSPQRTKASAIVEYCAAETSVQLGRS